MEETTLNIQVLKEDIYNINFYNDLNFNNELKTILNSNIFMIKSSFIYFTTLIKNKKEMDVMVSIRKLNDTFFISVGSLNKDNNQEDILSLIDGVFFNYDIKTKIFEIKDYKNNKIVYYSYNEVIDRKINPLKVDSTYFPSFVYLINKIVACKKNIEPGIFFKIKKKGYVLDSFKKTSSSVIGFFKNDDAYIKRIEELEQNSIIDKLTGVYNKSEITKRCHILIESLTPKDKLLFGIIDLDYFKNINDTYGHSFGDNILIAFSKALKKVIDQYHGIAGRIGGDEFLFAIPVKTNVEEELKPICRDIKFEIKNIEIEGAKFNLSSTMGLACYPKDGTSYDELFEKIDKALYRGKIKGRDCYIIYSDAKHGKLTFNNNKVQFTGLPERDKSDAAFVSECLDQLIGGNDLEKEIASIVEKMATHFRLEHITICDPNLNIAFQYAQDQNFLDKGYEILKDEHYQTLFKSDNMLQISDVIDTRLKNKEAYDYYSSLNIKALVQIKLVNNDTLSGYMLIDMSHERRAWQPVELMYFNILAKIISGFYYKYQKIK
jgi:diguanylate cyclase (GGDEF)-like protein